MSHCNHMVGGSCVYCGDGVNTCCGDGRQCKHCDAYFCRDCWDGEDPETDRTCSYCDVYTDKKILNYLLKKVKMTRESVIEEIERKKAKKKKSKKKNR